MSRILYRQLICHEDLALGYGKVTQNRGPEKLVLQQFELEFIFRSAAEIRALNYNKYTHVTLHTIPEGPLLRYYFDTDSYAVSDDDIIIKPDAIPEIDCGRYIRIIPEEIVFPVVYDTIIASASDEFTPIDIGGPKTTFRAPYPLDLARGYVRISLTTAPVGAAFIVDVTMNGASLFSTLVQIDDGMKTSVGSTTPPVLAITDVPDDAEFLVYVIQVGSTVAGTGLKVAVTGVKASL